MFTSVWEEVFCGRVLFFLCSFGVFWLISPLVESVSMLQLAGLGAAQVTLQSLTNTNIGVHVRGLVLWIMSRELRILSFVLGFFV